MSKATLHTLNRSSDSALLQQCRPLLAAGDGLLLIEDGVLHTVQPPAALQLPPQVTCYALQEDCKARGLLEHCHKDYKLVDYSGFVKLCTRYAKVIAWF